MKYSKGNFIIVPNVSYLLGKPPGLIAIFLGLCYHADADGICYPSRPKLARETGTSIRTVDKFLKLLEEDGAIHKTIRTRPRSKENYSNLYQIMEMVAPPRANKDTTPRAKNNTVTIPNLNYTQLTTEATASTPVEKTIPAPYTFTVALEQLGDSTWVVDKIIYNYWKRKGFVFENPQQFRSARSRELRPAKLLEGYSSIQINKTMDYCSEHYKDIPWSLETVGKIISNVLHSK